MAKIILIFLFSYLIQEIKSSNTKIVECIYHDFTQEYNLEIVLDSIEIHSFFKPINQKSQYTWTISNISDIKNNDQIISYQMMTINNTQVNATEYKKVIQLNGDPNSLADFYFFHMNAFGTNIAEKGGFGFAFKFNDYKYSLVHQLKQQNMIDHLSYAILPQRENEGSFFIGGIPEKLIKDVPVSKCKVNPHYITWGCELSNVIFGDLNSTHSIHSLPNYINIHYSYFQTGVKQIKAPHYFLEYIKKKILFSYLESYKCVSETEIICAVNIIQFIPKFNFVFENKVALIFDWNHLFDCTGKLCTLLLEENVDRNEWIFGTDFIKKYGMEFDYEDQSISFFTKKDYFYLKNDALIHSGNYNANIKNLKWLYCLIIVLLITLSGFLGWIKYSLFFKSSLKGNHILKS